MKNPDNCGIFIELVNFSAELDVVLWEIQNTTVFKGTSKSIEMIF